MQEFGYEKWDHGYFLNRHTASRCFFSVLCIGATLFKRLCQVETVCSFSFIFFNFFFNKCAKWSCEQVVSMPILGGCSHRTDRASFAASCSWLDILNLSVETLFFFNSTAHISCFSMQKKCSVWMVPYSVNPCHHWVNFLSTFMLKFHSTGVWQWWFIDAILMWRSPFKMKFFVFVSAVCHIIKNSFVGT